MSNAAIYGRLYNWYAVNDSRNIAPDGWHVPSDIEEQILVHYLGSEAIAGGKMKEAGTTHWSYPNKGATNESGFSALPGGSRNGSFHDMGIRAHFWSSSERDGDWAWDLLLIYIDPVCFRHGDNKLEGHSVRCVKD